LRTSAAYLAVGLLALHATLGSAAAPMLSVTDAWMRATPGTEVAAVYLTLHNNGPAAVTIVGARSPLAQAAMIHETQLVGTQSTMRAPAELILAPGQTLRFAPGGLHLMLHGLTRALAAGDQVPLELLLKDGGTLAVTAHVRSLTQE
jgi:copper(I)-binding protein